MVNLLWIFLAYLLIGIPINIGSALIVWHVIEHLCRSQPGLYEKMLNEHSSHGIRFNSDPPTWVKAVVTQLIWPLSVINTFINGHYAMEEIRRRIFHG